MGGKYQTPEDVRNEHIEKLGDALGPAFHVLWNDVTLLKVKWKQYAILYGESPERIDLLNSTAPLFFRIAQDALLDDILLHLARLADPVQTGKKANLTLHSLPSLIEDAATRAAVQLTVDNASTAIHFVRDSRNRRIAHRDADLSLNKDARQLDAVTRKEVADAIDGADGVLTCISERMLRTSPWNDVIVSPGRGADGLVRALQDGLEAREARRKERRQPPFSSRPDMS